MMPFIFLIIIAWLLCGILANNLAMKKKILKLSTPYFEFHYLIFLLHGPIALICIASERDRL